MGQSVLDMTAVQLAEKIQSGDLRSIEATEAYIHHLQTINPVLNCLVEDRFAEARREAEACDRQLRDGSGPKGRLFGVPISVKECFDVAGMKTTGGLVHRRNHIAAQDADVVRRLRKEGAIVLGKTNTPALCFCQETDNKVYGRTNNPWNPAHTAGGSSGGEGALIAAGGAAVGLGSDIGGSIRFPSHFNGVVGFRSGKNRVSQHGHFPYSEHQLQANMNGIGPLAKSVEDAQLVYDITATQSAPDVNIDGFDVAVPRIESHFPIGTETLQLLQEVATYLSGHSRVQHDAPPLFADAALIWQQVMSLDGGKGIANLAFPRDKRSGPLRAYLHEVATGGSDWHRYLSWAVIGARLFQPSQRRIEEIRETLKETEAVADRYFDHRVLVLPVYHSPAPRHGGLFREVFSIRKTFLQYMPYVAIANVLGLPSLVVPVGDSAEGLPIAVQLISKVGNEQALFHFGKKLENTFRGYERCTLYD